MTKDEFENYVVKNCTAKELFYEKALAKQQKTNKDRKLAHRWNNTKIERAVDKMWDSVIEDFYHKVGAAVNNASNYSSQNWLPFMDENEILDLFEDSMQQLDFDN
jgi:hypothetical protein